MIPVVFRPMLGTDIGYLLDCIVQGAKDPIYTQMRDSVYKARYQPIVKDLIQRASILVACLPHDTNLIAGFVVYDAFGTIPVLHWIHIRAMFQQQGLAKAILKETIPTFAQSLTMVSHLPSTKRGSLAEYKEHHKLQYDPFLIHKS